MTADDHKLKAAAMTDELGPPSPGSPPSPKALLERRRLLAAPPFSGDGVRWPQSEAEAHLLHRRKILTVNGAHACAWAWTCMGMQLCTAWALHGRCMGMQLWALHGHDTGMCTALAVDAAGRAPRQTHASTTPLQCT